MNKFKKLGLTALAGSLVATSAYAGEVTVAGGASMGVKNNSGTDGGKSWTMGNQLTFSGGGELDNGLTVALSFVLDHADNVASGFDSHSITVSSDTLGSITVAGDGTGNAQSALDTTAAGDIWDNGFTYTGANTKYTAMAGSDANNNKSINYTFPTIMDDLALAASYSGTTTATNSTTAWSATYTGIEGLSVSYGSGEAGSTTATSAGDVTTMKGSYAIGSFTAAYSNTESDKDSTGTDE
jgi:outer membrane protein OmpU